MISLVDKISILHDALTEAELPHAFGGALALAWCTERARGTIDIDINILIPDTDYQHAIDAMPKGVNATRKDLQMLKSEGQVRIWWDKTPLNIFLNSTSFHEQLAGRICWEFFADKQIPFLSCLDLAVFKAFFNRTKDWADLEEMYAAGTLNIEQVQAVLISYLGADDERIKQLGLLRSL
jgi:hypothetical protein